MISNGSSYGRKHSFIFHISSCYTTTAVDGSKKMSLHTSFRLPRELCRPEGMRLRVIQIILGFTPHPPPLFLICINTKQEQCGVKTNQGVWQAGGCWCLNLKILSGWHSETQHTSYLPMITCSAKLNQSHHCFSCNLHCNFWSYQEGDKNYDDRLEWGSKVRNKKHV